MLPLNRQVGRLPSLLLTLTLILFFSLPPLHLHGAELMRRPFAIPAADAEVTLETFSDQAGAQVVYLIKDVRGVATNPVHGTFATATKGNNILFGQADTSNGAGTPAATFQAVDFTVIDNVRVLVPEPSSIALVAAIAAGMMPLVRRWRRPPSAWKVIMALTLIVL